jgi:two-component system, OmpR family, sensor kinase
VILSLRARLLIGVVALVLAGMVLADAATYLSLQTFLYNQVDQQLVDGQVGAFALFGGPGPGGPRGPAPANGFPTGTVAERIGPDGTLKDIRWVTAFEQTPDTSSHPQLPAQLPTDGRPFTVAGTGSVAHYRVLVGREEDNDYVVVAIPLSGVDSILRQLVLLEAVIGAVTLLAIALLGLVIVRLELRPLERMGETAAAIAGGDLTRRVEPAGSQTEIGRLGLALNAMLAQIEAAFTERKAIEQRLRRFIADASHELRTPLTSIRGYAEMLRRGAESSPRDAELARRRIEEEAVRMSALVNDLLLLARLDQGRPLEREPVDLRRIAVDAAADASAVAPNRAITLDAPATVVVSGDDMRLRQVIGNLVRNALVHTPTGTPVEIGVRAQDGRASVTVADHGPGLQGDAMSKAFEPFYRADAGRSRDTGGAGLGLSIVAAVVEAHKGSVRVAQTPGGGATFTVELPLSEKPEVSPVPRQGEEESLAS